MYHGSQWAASIRSVDCSGAASRNDSSLHLYSPVSTIVMRCWPSFRWPHLHHYSASKMPPLASSSTCDERTMYPCYTGLHWTALAANWAAYYLQALSSGPQVTKWTGSSIFVGTSASCLRLQGASCGVDKATGDFLICQAYRVACHQAN